MTVACLTSIEERLTRRAFELWPDLEVLAPCFSVRFFPQSDLSRGDLYSSSCVDLAQTLKAAPGPIAERLLGAENNLGIMRVEAARGFLNAWFSNFDCSLSRVDSDPRVIVLPEPSREFSEWRALRLAARACVQHFVAIAEGSLSRVFVGGRELKAGGPGELWHALWDIFGFPSTLSTQKWEPDDFARIARESGVSKIFGLVHRAHLSGFFERAYQFRKVMPDKIEVIMLSPAAAWFDGLDQLETPVPAAEWNRDSLVALPIYLAGAVDGRGLDPEVSELCEADNLIWNLSITLARLRGVVATGVSEVRIENLVPFSSEIQRRLALLPLCFNCAASAGQVGELLEALAVSLQRVNHLLNSPSVRCRLERRDRASFEFQIMSGALAFFSSMMKRYSFLKKTDMVPGSYG